MDSYSFEISFTQFKQYLNGEIKLNKTWDALSGSCLGNLQCEFSMLKTVFETESLLATSDKYN